MKHVLPLLTISLLCLSWGARAENPTVQIETSAGNFSVELYADKAPKSVDNFMRYVREGFYSGTVFHRVIPDFMLQAGGYAKNYRKKTTHGPITNEADNGLLNEHGTVAMARAGDPHSATSQFFVNMADNDMLDFQSKTQKGWGYAVFGKVIDGMDTLEAMQEIDTGAAGPLKKNAPLKPIIIKQVTILSGDSEGAAASVDDAATDDTATEATDDAAVEDDVAEAAPPKTKATAKATPKAESKAAPKAEVKKTDAKKAVTKTTSDSKTNQQLDDEVKAAATAEADPNVDPYALYEPEPPDVPATP